MRLSNKVISYVTVWLTIQSFENNDKYLDKDLDKELDKELEKKYAYSPTVLKINITLITSLKKFMEFLLVQQLPLHVLSAAVCNYIVLLDIKI